MAAMSKSDHHATYEVVVTADLSSVGAASVSQQDLTVNGVDPAIDACVGVEPQTALETGITLGACRVKAANTVTLTIVNPTAGAVDPASRGYKVILARH